MAIEKGEYPCYSCGGKPTIILNKGEVWKYGYTRLSESDRYGSWHRHHNLKYFPQFEGTLGECAKEEKRKIYYYPVLPENLARKMPLNRPPGNKKD